MIENTTITVQGASHEGTSDVVRMDTGNSGCDAGAVARGQSNDGGAVGGRRRHCASGGPQANQAPRMVTRGANRQLHQTLNIGWLRGSIRCNEIDSAVMFLTAAFGEPEHQDRGMFFRRHRYVWEGSVILAYDLPDDNKADDHAIIDIPATPIEGLSVPDRMFLIANLQIVGFEACRVDLSWDDFSKRILPEDVYAVAMKGHAANVRYTELISSGHIKQTRATTCYLGKRGKNGGGKCVRIYRKDIESEGIIDAIRWEVEFSQDRARKAFSTLTVAQTIAELEWLIGTLVGGSCDFRDKDDPAFVHGAGHLERAPQYPWWESIRKEIGAHKLTPERKESTIRSTQQAFEYQWKKSLANIREFYKECKRKDFMVWLQSLLQEGREQLTKRHRRKREIEHARIKILEQMAAECLAEEQERQALYELECDAIYGPAAAKAFINSIEMDSGE